MIYTVGIRLKYERAFAAGKPPKRGADSNYGGGFVFRTPEDAVAFLADKGLSGTHMVIGVLADWERDTALAAGEVFRRLTRDAELVKL